jgi:GT2 family glycosyltransferase
VQRNSFNPLDYPACLSSPRQVEALSWHEHIPFAMALVQMLAPRIIVELGVHSGDSYLTFCQAVVESGKTSAVYGVDTWAGDPHAGLYGAEVLQKLRAYHDPLYGSFSRLVQSSFDEAALHFSDGSIDLLHIDGYHGLEAVSHDWNTWKPKLSERAVVLFHDINVRERQFGAWLFWERISAEIPHMEFIHGHGLGVLLAGEKAPEILAPLLASAREKPAVLRDFFQRLGSRITLEHQNRSTQADLAKTNQSCDELRAMASTLETRLAEALAERDAARSDLETRSKTIAELTLVTNDRQAELDRLRETIQAGEENRRDLGLELAANKGAFERLRSSAALGVGQAADFMRQLSSLTERMRQDHETLAAERRATRKLEEELKTRETFVLELEGRLKDCREQADRIDADRLALQERETKRQQSPFWRLTGPMRRLAERLDRVYDGRFSGRARRAGLLLRRPWQLHRNARAIHQLHKTGLFDAAFYRLTYPDVARRGLDPLLHYVMYGAAENRNPSALFDSRFYSRNNPDVAASGLNPLMHFWLYGGAEGRNPHPLFDTSYYLERYADVRAVSENALAHYTRQGGREGRSPHPLFDGAFYLRRYPDVAGSGLTPLAHFLQYGVNEGRDPHPLFVTRHYRLSRTHRTEADSVFDYLERGAKAGRNPNLFFDGDYYRETYLKASEPELTPLEHYIRFGARKGHRPHPLFDPSFYLAKYPDVARSGGDPFEHFVQYGAPEGRSPHALFDAAYYLRRYPDVASAGLNPLEHYLRYGAGEGRDPHPLFDTRYYSELYGDRDTPNALVDYLREGGRQRRNPNPLFDSVRYCAICPEAGSSETTPLEHYVRVGSSEGVSPHLLFDPGFYLAQNPDVANAGLEPLSHYLENGEPECRPPHRLFDPGFYLTNYPEVAMAGMGAIAHYLRFGAAEGRHPHPLFNTELFLEENPSIRGTRNEALSHYLGSVEKGLDPRDTPFAYRSWLATYGPTDIDSAGIRGRLQRLKHLPRFSLVLGVEADATLSSVEATVRSVLAQSYWVWELIVAVPTGVPRLILERVRLFAADDPRVRISRAGRTDAWEALNDGLAGASGEFVGFLSAGDVLDGSALFRFADEINRHTGVAVVYSDEDELDARGRRQLPHFKPDWNEELFRGWNYLGRLAMVDRRFARSAGGLSGAFAPSHEYDFLLRVIDQTGGDRVRHIPWVLCHRPADAAGRRGGLKSTREAHSAREALAASLSRQGIAGSVEPIGDRFHRVVYPLPMEPPLVTVVVPTRNRLDLLEPCLRSLVEKTDYPSLEILVIDNDSTDTEAIDYLDSLQAPHRVLRYTGAFNFSAINNFAVANATGSVLVFLNNDTEIVNSSWLSEMVRLAVRKDVGVVGSKLLYPDGSVQHAGVLLGVCGGAGHAFVGLPGHAEGYFGRAVLAQELSAVTAACLAMRRDVFEKIDGFDEDAFPVNFNDTDLCLRVRKLGLKVLLSAEAKLLHHESVSRRHATHFDDCLTAEAARFRERWWQVIRNDPFYSPNLSLDRVFSLAQPPRSRELWSETGVTRAVTSPNPYASLDNWTRANEVLDAPKEAWKSDRGWHAGLSVVILTLDKPDLICPLLDQLLAARSSLRERGLELEIIVGDTGSTDETVLRKYEELATQIVLERDLRYHFSANNNRLFQERVSSEKVLFLNNDIVFANPAESLLAMAAELDSRPDVGIVGVVLTYPDGRIQHAGIDFVRSGTHAGLPFHPYHGETGGIFIGLDRARDCPAVTGACLMIRSSLFAAVGGLDERYRTEGQDVDLCLTTRRHGYRSRLILGGRIDHVENGTRPKGSEDWIDRQLLRRRWAAFLKAGDC